MADMFLNPIMEKLISAGFRYLKDQVRWQKRTKEELEKLQGILPQIQAVVHFASSQEHITDQYPALNKWYWQLRDAIDDAVDVFDELEYMELEKQVTKNKKVRRVHSIMKSMKKRLVKIVKRAFKIDPNLKRLEEALKKLYKVSANVTTFLHLLDSANQEHKEQLLDLYVARETGSLPKNDLNGRDKEKESVVQWLRKPSNEHRGSDLYINISLLSIVGHGGMGKTTLLQHVYKDEEITKEFDLKMWVCVSNNFDVKKVIADMLESSKKKKPNLDSLDALQGCLEDEVMSKKFVLVLDDIWEENEKNQSKWENVFAPLASGGFGSKILITTRTDSVALMFAKVINKQEIYQLEGLEEDECLQLLNSHAFADVENHPPNDHKKLRAITGEIVKKLLGSPLAAKVIGGVLKDNLDERHWRTVLESNLLGQNSVDSILRLSYIVLPNHLQNCLAFCCMFPQDHVFDKDDLVRMWIALGFIQPSQGMTIEDIGGSYFDVLFKKSLFDKLISDHYNMHDLIHESASNFFAQECGKLLDDEESFVKISKTIRHLSVQTTNPYIIKRIGQFKYLRYLILLCRTSTMDLYNALNEIFKASRGLRLIYIYAPRLDSLHLSLESIPRLEMIPENIGNLIHLRCLSITVWDLTMFPRSLSNLYHLQYINYDPQCIQKNLRVDFFPGDINKLSNLHYLKFPMFFISSLICGIGKLKSLQELDMFDVGDMTGYRIGELVNMNDLCKLGINCLENVKDAEEACSAKLCAKKRLTDLTLCWSNTLPRNIDLDENVLDNLQPPKCLRKLYMRNYMGARSAKWMMDVDHISNLEKIDLWYCLELETLPPFGQLSFLKSLTLVGMPKVKWLESQFNENRPNLISLSDLSISDPLLLLMEPLRSIASLKKLFIKLNDEMVSFPNEAEQWFLNVSSSLSQLEFMCLESLESLPSTLESLSSLQTLFIWDVPMLRELPNLPLSLKSLYICGSFHPELKERYGEDGGSDRHKIAHIRNIEFSTYN